MRPMKAHFLTGVITLMIGAVLLAIVLHQYLLEIPRLARVDVGRLVAQQQQALVQKIKPGLDAQEQAKLFEEAKAFGARLDGALDQVSQECRCALINTAALLKTTDSRIPDLTEKVAMVAGLPLLATAAK